MRIEMVSAALLASSVTALASCSHQNVKMSQSAQPAANDFCEIAVVALRSAVRNQEEAPLGLDAGCVREYATSAGKIYVDARFMKDGRLESVSERSCTRDNFIIRFDAEHNTPSPAPGVIFLSVGPETSAGREFYLTIEESNWTTRAPTTLAMPPCYPAFGILNRSGMPAVWKAAVVPAPRGPDDL
jgi:hypothetical protein